MSFTYTSASGSLSAAASEYAFLAYPSRRCPCRKHAAAHQLDEQRAARTAAMPSEPVFGSTMSTTVLATTSSPSQQLPPSLHQVAPVVPSVLQKSRPSLRNESLRSIGHTGSRASPFGWTPRAFWLHPSPFFKTKFRSLTQFATIFSGFWVDLPEGSKRSLEASWNYEKKTARRSEQRK